MAHVTQTRYVRDDYVISGVPNEFNKRMSFWISKLGYTIAFYCFSAENQRDVDEQLPCGWDSYIHMFEDGLDRWSRTYCERMKTDMKVYRFELCFDGEPQEVGFLQGLDDIGLPIREETRLADLFESLPAPHLGGPCSFWFTESGLEQYRSALDQVAMSIAEYNWSLMAASMPVTAELISSRLYEDQWQMAWKPECLTGNLFEFKEIKQITDI